MKSSGPSGGPKRGPRRRPIGPRLALGALLAVLALGAGHAVLWRIMAGQLEAGLATWVEIRRAQGWRVEHAPPVRGGWPFSATLSLGAVRLEGGAATLPGGVALEAERVVLRVTLPRLNQLRVEMPGAQRLRLDGAEWRFAADELVALVPLEADTPPREAVVLAGRLRLATPAGPMEVASLRFSAAATATATDDEAALQLSLEAAAIDLPMPPGAANPVFGRRIESLAAEAALSGPVPPGRVPARRAEAWRDGGGSFELSRLAVQWGPAQVAAAATLALDEALQPMGAGSLRVTGANEALQALADAGLVGRRAAGTARIMLPLMARPNAAGATEIEVPVTLEDRTLALARIPVLRVQPWIWPAAEPRR
ncbi:DUF2125 domain-containing protein [Falsiroseomonas sp. E2-1-a20]|uniref:DUF2125 domain-containing protein n=1 Tax=Falsiroseomonas sp. E2-1-a20 TaxID=3239300 RepID=UPI003F400E33